MRRIATFLMYMNGEEEFTGGNTIFPHLQLAIRPTQGDAIVFYSHLHDGTLDEQTMHSGCTITSGFKSVANVWIR
jgi:prolyl 4-hydroxylase